MREAFVHKNFRGSSLVLVKKCAAIITRYQANGLRLTLRQLYYQLVTTNTIVNSEKSYKNLGSLVSDARLAGLLDWSAIEDRVRVPKRQSEFTGLKELAETAISSYRLPRWEGQDNYVELWVEKDALAGVLAPLGREFHVTIMVNKGYSSQSAMYEASKRFLEGEENGQSPVLLYLGDHDPSGEDMVRDIRDRLSTFGVEVDVRKVALTTPQVQEYDPPPNPAKLTDSRAAAYIEKHGPHSWEVDAIPPEELQRLIRVAIKAVVDLDAMEVVKAQEKKDKQALRRAVAELTGEDADDIAGDDTDEDDDGSEE